MADDIARHFTFPTIATVGVKQPLTWLARGWQDFAANPLASLFYGLCFAGMGGLLHAVFDRAVQYTSALAMGFVLVGPFLAIGLYDLSRQRELKGSARLYPSLTAWRANMGGIGIYVLMVSVIFLVWARASLVVFALFYSQPMPSISGFMAQVLALDNIEFLAVYFAVGAVFATLVFALSVVSVPYLMDGTADAVSAAAASVLALVRSPLTMLVWAAFIALLIGVGLATFYVGLIVTVPVIGHATWHAYRDVVKPTA